MGYFPRDDGPEWVRCKKGSSSRGNLATNGPYIGGSVRAMASKKQNLVAMPASGELG